MRRTVFAAGLLSLAWLSAGGSADAQDLDTGRHCYFLDGEVLTAAARLDLDASGGITGTLDATVHDDANGYYTSYTQEVVGRLDGARADVEITTWIEYDVQDSRESWTLTSDSLVIPQAELAVTECAALDDSLAATSAHGWTVMGEYDYPHHYRRVAIDPGFSTVTYRSGVVRGERDIYLLRAREGQELTLWIDAAEDNAVFDLEAPDGSLLAGEALDVRVALPMHGEYRIVVGGTRGNAGYELVIALR